MKRLLTALCILFALTGCDYASDYATSQWSQAKEGIADALREPRQIPRGAKPEIILDHDKITFDGKPLRLGDDLQNWVKILGTNYRPWKVSEDVPQPHTFIWDDLGVVVSTAWQGKKTVESISVELNFKQIYEKWEPDFKDHKPGIGVIPAKFFRGYLQINGVPIDAKSTIREVNRRANGNLSIHCSRGINVCTDYLTPVDAGAPFIGFGVDSRKEDSLIYGVSIESSMSPHLQ